MNENNFKIVSIDPGGVLGVCVMDIEFPVGESDYVINSIETQVIALDDYVIKDENKSIMTSRLQILNEKVSNIIQQHQPLAFAIETAFVNLRFPKAVMQLSQYFGMINYTVTTIDPYIKMFEYPPKYIKAIVAGKGKGNADKDAMMNAVSNYSEITKHVNPSLLTEHEVDAIAIGYVLLQEIRRYPFILYAT